MQQRMKTIGVRITLRDVPGALAAIAAALSQLGGNIVGIDVHELDGDHVIDDIVLGLPDGVSPAQARQALLAAGAVSVVSRSLDYRVMDAQVRCLNAIADLLRGGDPDMSLTDGLSQLVSADVRLARRGDAPAATRAVDSRVPVVDMIADDRGTRSLLAVPLESRDADAVVLLERSGRVRFSATEVARVWAMLRVHEQITRLANVQGRRMRSLRAHPSVS